jgi:hypothetical protein
MSAPKTLLLRTLKKLLVIIARGLLKAGIDCRQLIEMAKVAFVEVATNEYGIRDRKTNIARVAVLTGLTRKEVKRIRDGLTEEKPFGDMPEHILDRLMSSWYEDDEFSNEGGDPRTLDLVGEKGSFHSLAKKYGGDIPAGALKKELMRVGCVKVLADGRLEVVRRDPSETEEAVSVRAELEAIQLAGNGIEAHFSIGEDWPFVCVSSKGLRNGDVRNLASIAKEKMSKSAEDLGRMFEAYETIHGGSDSSEGEMGVMQICYKK